MVKPLHEGLGPTDTWLKFCGTVGKQGSKGRKQISLCTRKKPVYSTQAISPLSVLGLYVSYPHTPLMHVADKQVTINGCKRLPDNPATV